MLVKYEMKFYNDERWGVFYGWFHSMDYFEKVFVRTQERYGRQVRNGVEIGCDEGLAQRREAV